MNKINKVLFRLSPLTVIRRSSFFDSQWYKDRYGIDSDPAKHYLNEGWKLGYNPSDRFSSKDYLINNPDLKDVNPLLHYEVFGRFEGRRAFVPAREFKKTGDSVKIEIPYAEYHERIKAKEVVSFDVFDTLVIRPFVKADEIFDYLEKKCGMPGFGKARRQAEAAAREQLKKEVDLDEIYEFIDENYAFLKEKETEAETRFCHVNPLVKPIYEEARKLGKRVIAVSDMYLPENIIRKIVEASGYAMDSIYVSCDLNMTKGQGSLYEEVLKREKIDKDQMIHFGDNYISDYSQAITMGIEAFQTPKLIDYVLSDPKYPWLKDYSAYAESLSDSIYLAQICEYLVIHKEDFFRKLAYILGGPLAASYLSFVGKKALEHDIDELLFVARDGYILKDLFDKYFMDSFPVDDAYAYLSRACIYAGSISNKLNDDKEKLLKIAAKHIPVIIIHDSREENLAEYEKHAEQIEGWSKECDRYLEEHLGKITAGHDKIATVDMFSGNYTSQKGAVHYLKEKIRTGFYAGNFAQSDLKHEAACERLLGMRDNVPVKLSEFLISSPEASVIGIGQDGMPVYEAKDSERQERYEKIYAGSCSYLDDHLRFFEPDDGFFIGVENWLMLCERYLCKCSDEEVEMMDKITDSENPVSDKNDIYFNDLISRFRHQGY